MSYSFNFTAATKFLAKKRVVQELATVVTQQPMHAYDAALAQRAASDAIDALTTTGSQVIAVSISGSIGYQSFEAAGEERVTSIALSLSVGVVDP